MNIIYALDDFDPNKKHQVIRLKKEYNITLLNIFPPVLELIIHDYVHDIIAVDISFEHEIDYLVAINIKDQYINYVPISITYNYYVSSSVECLVGKFTFSTNITNIIIEESIFYPYTLFFNKYMQQYYNKNTYIKSMYDVYGCYDNTINVTCNNNTLTCKFNGKVQLSIRINNHKLFKNAIVIIKYLKEKLFNEKN